MRTVNAKCGAVIPIGRLGENEATAVVFDVAEWIALFGAGTFTLLHQRSGDPAPYPCSIEHDGTTVTWTVTNADLGVQGYGKCELVYTVGDTVAKSVIYTTVTGAALTGGTEPPEPWEDWVQRVLEAGAAAQEAKEQWENMSAEAVELPTGEQPTAHYEAGVLTLGIPKPSEETYIHNQMVSSAVWNIVHNLGRYPSVTIVDSGGNKCVGDVDYIDENTITVTFSAPFGGTAYLN